MTATSTLTTLGGFAFKVNGLSPPSPATHKARALMAFLIMNRGADSARERLLEIFWPDAEPDNARKSLNTALHSIRHCLRAAGVDAANTFLVATYSVVRWTADTNVDALQFAALAAREDPAANQEALQLYTGDFLEGDYDDWAVTERERLTTLYESALAKAVTTSRDPNAARLLLARNPYAEEAYATLIEAEMDAGRSGSANEWVERCRKALAEVGEKPSEAFDERFGHIGLRSLEVPASNLPQQATSFVGRDAELAEIKALLAKSHLVTITGTGGVGKTRAALQAGAEVLDASGEGVWVADLAKVSGAESVIPEIASAFGVKSQGFRTLLDHVLAYLKRRRLLLILDNCEHVVAEAARVVEAIIRECPRVTVLATSRENLGVRGEQIYRLPSLEVPHPDAKPGAKDALAFGAVALFVARAFAVDAHFSYTDETARVVVEICRRLDGIALAIELAAARVMSLSVHQLLERLRDQFRLLTSSDRAAPLRQQTMRATLDWSYNLLSEAEKKMFRRLAIFQGGCTIEAINASGMDDSRDESSILERVSSLVNKSLVTVEFRAQSQRYRLLEPLRQYGLECLAEHGELDASARSHARQFTEFGRQAAEQWLKIPELEWLANIEEEIDNLRAALDWSLTQRNDPVLGAQLTEHLRNFWHGLHHHEGSRWLNAAEAAVSYEAHPALSTSITLSRARLFLQTDLRESILACEAALPRARALDDPRLLLRALLFYSGALVWMNRLEEAEPIANEGLALAERSSDHYHRYMTAYMLMNLANLNQRRGNLNAARDYVTRFTDLYEQLRIPLERHGWWGVTTRASQERMDGNLSRAIELTLEARRSAQLTKDATSEIHSDHALGVYSLMAGEVENARNHARSVLALSRDELLPHGIPAALQVLAGAATQRGEREAAARLLGYAEARFPELPIPRNLHVEVDPKCFIQPLLDYFGDARLAQLMAEGAAWSEDQAVEEALKI